MISLRGSVPKEHTPAPIDNHSWEIAVWDAAFSSIIEVMRK